jgi:hypothetical protein
MEMTSTKLNILISNLKKLPENQLHWVENVIDILNCSHSFILHDKNLMNEEWFESFGDALMIHHAFSNEPFTKDKFEHALVNTAKLVGLKAEFATRGNRGYDIVVESTKFSLKTQADKSIKSDLIWISKYMELGKGEWSDKPNQLQGFVTAFLAHLEMSHKILILRCLKKAPNWKYELIEIPKNVLERSKNGNLKMMIDSIQMPKPGYCEIVAKDGSIDFQLYFDGGTERKLQIRKLRKSKCNLIGEWNFEPNNSIKNIEG